MLSRNTIARDMFCMLREAPLLEIISLVFGNSSQVIALYSRDLRKETVREVLIETQSPTF
jgi:hypothetical protein